MSGFQKIYFDDNTPCIYMAFTGKQLSLSEIANFIFNDNDACISELLHTVRSCINAKHTLLHIQAVKKLQSRCSILSHLLLDKEFTRKSEIERAFAELADYAGKLRLN